MSLPQLPDVPRDNRRTATLVAVGVLGVLCVGALVFGLRGLFAPANGEPGRRPAPVAASSRPSTATPQTTGGGADSATSKPAAPSKRPTSTPPDPAADLVQFGSPSGNIRCALSSAGARCDIADRQWSPGARPADCTSDWGHGVFVDGRRASVVCASDTVAGARAMRYGRSVSRGDFTCHSGKDGMTCRNRASGHSFTLARDAYRVR